jgi:Tol biopolymer transport system component
MLAERSGEIVTREELRTGIWGDATFVEFDQGLNYCVRQVRVALRDNASQPLFIETLPKQGYRFIAPVVADGQPAAIRGVVGRRTPVWRTATVVLLLIATCVVAWSHTSHGSAAANHLQVTRVSKLTSYPGDEREPAISPDGAYVAFSWSGEAGDNYDIYLLPIGSQTPLRLTRDPAVDSFPAWSPDGRLIAFMRRSGTETDIVLVPARGGPERTLYRGRLSLDAFSHGVLSWSHDGRWIAFAGQLGSSNDYALNLLSVETGAVSGLSAADPDALADVSPAFSPDGKSVAFVRLLAPPGGRVLIQPLSSAMAPRGRPLEVSKSGPSFHSPAWLDDGLLFADRQHIFQWQWNKEPVPIYAADGLWGMSLGPEASGGVRHVVVSSDNIDDDIWELPLEETGRRAAEPAHVLQRSTTTDFAPAFSRDGRQIAFSSVRSGNMEIWVVQASGGHPRQVTHLGAPIAAFPAWSPDGSRIAFQGQGPEDSQVYVADVSEGVARSMAFESPGAVLPSWSGDGRYVYASIFAKTGSTIVRKPVGGGPIEHLWEGAWQLESPDSTRLYYLKRDQAGIYSRSLEGDLSRNPEELAVPEYRLRNQRGGFAPVRGGIYYVSVNDRDQPGPFRFFDEASRTSRDVAAPAAAALGPGLTVSPDRRRLVYSARTPGSDLLLLDLERPR